MADNVEITPGSGANVAADEIGGVLHQRVKVGIGVDGTAVDVSDANPLPVDIPSQSGLALLLTRLYNTLVALPFFERATQRARATAIIESGTVTTVSTVTTATNVTSVNGFSGLAAERVVYNQNMTAWQLSVRSRITNA